MSHRRLPLFALVLALSACVVKTPVAPAASAAPQASAPVPKSSAKTGVPTARPTAAMTPGGRLPLLKAPAAGTIQLVGRVTIDAHYAVRVAGAGLIGNDGSTLIGNDGSTLIGNDGSTLVGNDAATAVNAAAGLIGLDGGSLIGLDGSTLIGLDGSTLVAAGAGNLIGKRKLDLMQVAARETFQVGSLLPAAAMELQVRLLESGEVLPLGVDDQGTPVLTILTNAKGAYTVHLPEMTNGKAYFVTARMPGTTDVRVIYGAVVPKAAKAGDIDEDTALATDYFREAFVSRLVRLSNNQLIAGGNYDWLPEAMRGDPIVDATFQPLTEAAKRAHAAPGESDVRQRARARATADVLFAQIDLAELIDSNTGRPVLEELRDLLRAYRDAATAKMRARPAYFNAEAELVNAYNLAREQAGQPRFEIRKPADVGQFVLQSILMSPDRTKQKLEIPLAFAMVDFPADQLGAALAQLEVCINTLLFAAGTTLLANPPMADGTPILDAAAKAMETTPPGY